ncbi:putative membrane protein YdjX (TVP38/TMEM64 family) [Bacillus pakistanensis]|uniref:Membrane protein YdjX (TVP38/TMEM64 family) n=1 Tax=Rossellomorea pakistanensis TaxID=992288 RepID=A0ABS2NCN3_9BACI|nr:VTT domain-containing protein [Bacillus pakistanensis]MBM7585614.1 putative membrane protein YdjX (TVP38/TMEM64 family) [Bacillus pakistanensis]
MFHLIKEKYKFSLEILLNLALSAITTYLLFAFLPTLLPVYKVAFVLIMLGIVLLNLSFVLSNNKKLYKITKVALIVSCSFVFVIIFLFYMTKILVLTDTYGVENVLRENLAAAKLIFFLICFAQPIILPLPEAVTIPAGSAVFGPLIAACLGFLGTILGIVAMFFIARIGGTKLASKLVKEKHLKKYQEYVAKNETLILVLLFIVPILPDEIICVGAGIGGVTFKRFLWIAFISKFITSSLLAFSVQFAKMLSLSRSELVLACSVVIGLIFVASYIIKRFLIKNKPEEGFEK